MRYWGCQNCKEVFRFDNEPEARDTHYPYEHIPCPCCSNAGDVYFYRETEVTRIKSDSLDGIVNPIDGKKYDSKSAYHRTIKDAGCNIVEDNIMERKKTIRGDLDITQDLKNAIHEVEAKTGVSL